MENYARQILGMTDEELERFVLEWIDRRTDIYVERVRFSGAGDLGRDVVGFLSTARHQGGWHNYQCKQYGKNLPTDVGIREVGKVLYHAYTGAFTAPLKYFFVAPRGVNRNLEALIFNPTIFQMKLLDDWDRYCAETIVEDQKISLDPGLTAFINSFDFSCISRLTIDEILKDPQVKPVLVKWFGADPGPAPKGVVPSEIQASELPYIGQLVEAYGDKDGKAYNSYTDVEGHPQYGRHLARQRERFYDADAFKRFYRDNTEKEVVEMFENDIFHGVAEICDAGHGDKLRCVDAVMSQAASIQVSGPLAPHARTPVKQGVCHHFANDNRLRWKR